MAGRKPLKKFEPFPGLPVELRLKIWKLALPRACKLEICGYPCSVSKGHSIIFQHASPARYPSTQAQKDLHYERALLRVCKESREVYHCQLPYVMLFESKARQSKPNWGRSTPTTRVIWHELRFGDEDVLEIKNFALMMTWTRKHSWKALVGHDWAPKIKALSLPSDVNLDRAIILEKIMACFEGIQRIDVGSVIWEKRLPTAEEWGQARMAKKV